MSQLCKGLAGCESVTHFGRSTGHVSIKFKLMPHTTLWGMILSQPAEWRRKSRCGYMSLLSGNIIQVNHAGLEVVGLFKGISNNTGGINNNNKNKNFKSPAIDVFPLDQHGPPRSTGWRWSVRPRNTDSLGSACGPIGYKALGRRNWEGFGADPYLQGEEMKQIVEGIQKNNVVVSILLETNKKLTVLKKNII